MDVIDTQRAFRELRHEFDDLPHIPELPDLRRSRQALTSIETQIERQKGKKISCNGKSRPAQDWVFLLDEITALTVEFKRLAEGLQKGKKLADLQTTHQTETASLKAEHQKTVDRLTQQLNEQRQTFETQLNRLNQEHADSLSALKTELDHISQRARQGRQTADTETLNTVLKSIQKMS